MLCELSVRNLAVLAKAAVAFGPGLNVLTGGTGAGKSIVVDSLALLAGGRASADMIRSGTDVLTVTGVFEPAGDAWRPVLTAAGLAEDDDGDDGEGGPATLVLRREIHRNGRNRAYVNDQPATVRVLADLAPALLGIHGQREELGLTQPDLQREWLDRSGGAPAEELLARVAAAFERWAAAAARVAAAGDDRQIRAERLDLLRFQAREIDSAGLAPGEDEELRRERAVLRNAEAILHALGTAAEDLFEDEASAVDRLARSEDLLAGIAEWEGEAAAWRGELEEVRIRIEEVARSLGRRREAIEIDPGRLDEVEQRLAVVERLVKKYGGDTRAVLDRRWEIGDEIDALEGAGENREALVAEVAARLTDYRAVAAELSAHRQRWAEALTRRLQEEIAELGLAKARFEVLLEDEREEPGRHGVDRVVFQFAPNPGEAPQPLARIASGGELSRVSLGLQLASRSADGGGPGSAGDGAPTLIFDEVDAGVGGAQAAALGRKLRRLGARGQTLVVTHLPQVASHGHRHFRVEKTVDGGRTSTSVRELSAEERVEEVARMLAGREVTELSRQHARELLAAGGEDAHLTSPGGAKAAPDRPRRDRGEET